MSQNCWINIGFAMIDSNTIIESSGLYGKSFIQKYNFPKTGEMKSKKVKLDDALFGEGLCILNNHVYVLTWKSKQGFKYQLSNLKKIDTFNYDFEGWGITTDGTHLIISDGTYTIRYLDPKTYKMVRKINVKFNGTPVHYLNELEYVNGYILANIWLSHTIAIIDPKSGHVIRALNLSDLAGFITKTNDNQVLNGIAYHPQTGHLLVTGKEWPIMFEIDVPFIRTPNQ